MTESDVEDRFQTYHVPALLNEVLAMLAGTNMVLDGTLGGGGHASALLGAGVNRVVGVDRDPEAIASAGDRLQHEVAEGRFLAVNANYAQLDQVPELAALRFDGILLDLGISSHQVDASERGFSFRAGAPLDMRMEQGNGLTAADVLNEWSDAEIANVFRMYGDEPKAARLAREVVRRRARKPFATSDDLVGAIRGAYGSLAGAPEFARLFQAIRIAVNDEIAGLERALPALRDRLAPGGTMAIIAYHSGEDRLIKHTFRAWSEACVCPPRHPLCTCGGNHALGRVITKRATIAGAEELARNPRARSAKLRAWRRDG